MLDAWTMHVFLLSCLLQLHKHNGTKPIQTTKLSTVIRLACNVPIRLLVHFTNSPFGELHVVYTITIASLGSGRGRGGSLH